MKNLEDKMYKVREVAEYFNVATVTIYRWIKQGKIEIVKIDGITRIPKDQIEQLVEINRG